MSQPYRKPGGSRFALIVSAAILLVGEGMVLIGYLTGVVWPEQLALWSLFPAALALVALVAIRSFKGERTLPTTSRTYSVHAPAYRKATAGALLGVLEERGYQLEARPGEGGDVLPGDTELRGRELSARDRRLPPEAGELRIQLRVQDAGALLGFVEAIDTGPGFYDELAQFAVVALAALEPDLAYAAEGKGATAAAPLADELPAEPYGLALLS